VYLLLFVVLIELLPATAIPPATEHHGPPLPEPSAIAPAQWFGMVTLTEEWRPYLGGPAKGYVSGQLWSLCYEEQFYLVMGLAIVLSRSRLFTTLGVLTLLIFLNVLDLNAVLGRHLGLDLNSLQMRLPGLFVNGLWLSFAAGIAVYYRANYATPIFKRCLDGFLLVGLVMTLRQVKSFWDFQANLTGYLLTGFITACILSALHRYDAEISAARVTRPLQWAGRMCYSLYLVHAPVAILIQWNLFRLGICSPTAGLLITLPAAMTASLLLSRVFHVYVEARFLNPPQRARVPGSG
jgi:peptidoglycan/LPS O-acetylase OafA/YrhL